jgi:arginase
LRVFFPLWQGAGVHTRVPDGARALRERLGGDALEIPVTLDSKLEKDHGITARGDLIAAFQTAQTVFSDLQNTVLLGGDCSSDLTLVAASNTRFAPDLAVIWLDAHADLNTPQSSPSGHLHGMVLRALLGDGDPDVLAFVPRPLEPRQVFLAGARDFDAPEADYVQSKAVRVLSVDELCSDPSSLAHVVRDAGFTRVHVHLDLDILDLAHFSSTGFSGYGGIAPIELEAVIDAIHAHLQIVSFAVTEYAPSSDQPRDLETVVRLVRALEGV